MATGYVTTIATVLVGLFLVPFVLQHLDREEYAIFILAGDLLMWLGLLEIGLAAVLNVRSAQMSARPNTEKLSALASTTFLTQCGIAVMVAVFGAALAFWFPHGFDIRATVHADASQLILLMAAAAALQVATQTFSALLIGHQQIHIDNAVRLLLLVMRTLLTVALLHLGFGLQALGIAHLAAVAITGLIAWIRVYRLLPDLTIHPRMFDMSLLVETGKTGIWFSLGSVAGILIMSIDRIVAAKIVSIEAVTTLALTSRLYLLAWTFLQQVTNTARPALAQIIGSGEMGSALATYKRLLGVSSAMAVVTGGAIWAANNNFVQWWVGATNYGGSTLDAFLALNLLIHAWVLPSRAVLVAAMAYVPQNAVSRFTEGALNLALSVVLGHAYGLVGIAAATALAGILVSGWYFPKLTCSLFGVPWRHTYLSPLLRTSLLGTLVLFAAPAAKHLGELIGGITGAAAAGGTTLLIAGVVAVLLFEHGAVRKVMNCMHR